MRFPENGPALVLVYAGNQCEAVLAHAHDGGEAYMAPYLRKGIQYAKTHYDSGNIVDVLLSEPETQRIEHALALDMARVQEIRHVYYVTYRWEAMAGRKVYHLLALHLKETEHAGPKELPLFRSEIPTGATILV